MFRYKLVGGVYDGQEQAIPHNVLEITVPSVDPTYRPTPEMVMANMKNHGHGFPKGTRFYYYVSSGQCDKGFLVLQFAGYVDNPIQNPNPDTHG